MAKRGQKIDELYLDIGLNIAQLQLDFDTAGKTVSDSIARLNGKANNIHLKLDADLAKLDGVGTELDKIKVRHQAINRELDIQRQKEQKHWRQHPMGCAATIRRGDSERA